MTIAQQNHTGLDIGFLPIGATHRPHHEAFKPPSQVRSTSDLPLRLFVGSLDESSFAPTACGWSARYPGDNPGCHVSLRYDRERNQLKGRFFWGGVEGLSVQCPGDSWRDLHRYIAVGFPTAWHDIAQFDIEARYNARYIRERDGDKAFIGFPEGSYRTVVIPLPSERLAELAPLFEAIDADARVAAPVHAYVTISDCRADYDLGRCPDVPDTPDGLARYQRKATGLSCPQAPSYASVETAAGGKIDLIVAKRRVYLAQVRCAFRDLGRVLEHCFSHGLIGAADPDSTPSQYPQGAEWAAMVVPGGYEQLGLRLELYDEAKTRRMVYGPIVRDEYRALMFEGLDAPRGDILHRLQTASELARTEPVINRAEHLAITLN
jgi:hypothetical protein